MDSLEITDKQSAAIAVAPRVSLDDIKSAISAQYFVTADRAVGDGAPTHESLKLLSLCFIVMTNGFVVVGKSAPASKENFDPELGRKFAYEDAVRQLWPLMGYALREKIAA